MGQFPRKRKLRGPSRVTSRYPPGTLPVPSRYPVGTLSVPCTFRRGLIAKIRQNLSNLAEFGEKNSKIFSDF